MIGEIPRDTAAILVADLHLHNSPQWRFEWCEKFVGELLKLSSYPDRVPDLWLLGDVFEQKNYLDARVVNLFLKLVLNWDHQAEVVWIAGQHDSYVPGHATLEGLRGVRHLTVVDSKLHNVVHSNLGREYWFVPFCRDLNKYYNLLDHIPDNARVLTHMPVSEALPKQAQGDYLSCAVFDRFEWVWSGDIHKHGDYGKLSYVGAPSQRDWRDFGVDGVIGVITTEGEFDRYSVEHPRHIKITGNGAKERFALKKINRGGQYIVRYENAEPSNELLEHPNVLKVEESLDKKLVQKSIDLKECDEKVKSVNEIITCFLDNNELPEGTTKEDLYQIALGVVDEVRAN